MAGQLEEHLALITLVERGSFAAAAKALDLAPSQITKRIQALEQRLSVQLVHRTTRKVTLTEAGRLLYESVREVAALVSEAEERARSVASKAHGRMKVILPSFFASSGFHHEVIPAYLEAYPDVHLEIDIVGESLDHLGDAFDLLVAGRAPHERFPDTACVHRKLLAFRGAIIATPTYLARSPPLAHPADLLAHNCLSYPRRRWHFVDPQTHEPVDVETRGTLTSNSNAMLYAGVMRHLGVAWSVPYFFDREIADGRVVTVLDRWVSRAALDMHIFYPPARFVPRRTRAFIEALSHYFDGDPRATP
ncbi:MAG: LysR family transcriptional regulator [Deltaproteobacteria bacterium]|nr:LysR family transcriptional regulator [Deltaproteobacteria bacterium]